jgi:hypothetical protein
MDPRPSFETLAEFIIGPRFARTRWQAPQDEVFARGLVHRLAFWQSAKSSRYGMGGGRCPLMSNEDFK